MDWQVRPMGADALLVEFANLTQTLHAAAWLRDRVASGDPAWRKVVDVVPGARTVLMTVGQGDGIDALRAAVHAEFPPNGAGRFEPVADVAAGEVVVIPVRYDGPDLADVARHTGRSVGQVVAAHVEAPWEVAFMGFSPGFGYLTCRDGRLAVPRRSEPRERVRTGSVGLADEFSGIYPRESPGGWQIIGHTTAVLWDLRHTPPARLRPGVRVRFEEARG